MIQDPENRLVLLDSLFEFFFLLSTNSHDNNKY